MKRIVIGTAGHIDHGKTTLIKALTGIDCDRLKEEKERGITLDLGFAHYKFGEEILLGIIDVPGHEKLVRHMVAGAWGIDMVLFVIAADEGIMPQTREHLDICELIGLERAIFAITKIDLVEEEMVELVKEELKDFLKGRAFAEAPIVPCSSITGVGLERLKEVIKEEALKTREKKAEGIFRLPVDRVFTLKGIGVVVTGTCVSGRIRVGEEVQIYPSEKTARIRGIQVYHESVEEARAGERVALNLQGIEKEEIERGVVIARPKSLLPSFRVDATVRLLKGLTKPLKNGTILRFHMATAERNVKLLFLDRDEAKPGEETIVQLLFTEPVAILPSDPYILRNPKGTVGGGRILDIDAPKHRRKRESIERMAEIFLKGSELKKAEYHILKGGFEGLKKEKFQILMGLEETQSKELIKRLIAEKKVEEFPPFLVHEEFYLSYKRHIRERLEEFFRKNPQKIGMSKEELRSKLPPTPISLFQKALNEVLLESSFEMEKDRIRKIEPEKGEIEEIEKKIEEMLFKAWLSPPSLKELSLMLNLKEDYLKDILERLIFKENIVKVRSDLFFHREAVNFFKEKVLSAFKEKAEMTVQDFKNLFELSRKYLIPLLEYLDSIRLTIRVGDKRILRGS